MVDDGPAPKIPTDLQKLQFDYAWKWFCYHADQRIKMFNYMLVVFGIAAAGILNALDTSKEIPTIAIACACFISGLFALIFALLDRRNRDLVWLSEDTLIHLEKEFIFEPDHLIRGRCDKLVTFGLLWRQELSRQRARKVGFLTGGLTDAWLGKHRFWMPAIGYLIAALFFLVGI